MNMDINVKEDEIVELLMEHLKEKFSYCYDFTYEGRYYDEDQDIEFKFKIKD